jgi:hypothetical protein
MRALLEQRVFSIAGTDLRWADVIVAAVLRGDWIDLEATARLGRACLEHATRTGRSPNAREVAAAAEFRYAHDLESARDMRAWLARWQLSPGAWMTYIRRTVARSMPGIARMATSRSDEGALAGVDDDMLAEGACSGALPRFARRLAARLGLVAMHGFAIDPEMQAQADAVCESLRAALRAGGSLSRALDAAWCDERCGAAVRAELALHRLRDRIASDEAVAAQIGARYLEWILLDYRMLAFPDEAEAAEAALCAREDGDSLCEVAAESGRPLLATRALACDVDESVRARLLAAREREVIGPLPSYDEHLLVELMGKWMPSSAEPEVAQRARRLVLARALRRAMDAHVEWAEWPR